ncbi:MAG: ABC transporter permease [Bacteroidales bacterium]|nr:ABC transporter permease [Bacteroidales bacterium]
MLIAIVLFMVSMLITPGFSNSMNIESLFTDVAILGFLVIGETLVILTGGIDLSVGNVASMSTVMIAWAMINLESVLPQGLNFAVSIIISLLIAAALGLIIGMFIAYLKIPPLIATLGAMWIAKAIATYPLRGVPTSYPVKSFSILGRFDIAGIPLTIILLIFVAIIVSYILSKWKIGRRIYATGGNVYASHLSGIKTKSITVGVYVASAVFAAFGGVLLGSYSGTGYPRSAEGYELYAIAAVVMGGVQLNGGEGNLWRTLVGVFILRLLYKIVIFNNVSGYIEGMFVGVIFLASLWLNSKSSKSNGNIFKFSLKRAAKSGVRGEEL